MLTTRLILQEDHYYPFGLNISALSSTAPLSKPNQFKYNGNEEQTEFDLNLYDFNARMYDATLGRFANIDPLADIPFQLAKSPYQFGWNNPILYFDPSGECPCFALPWIIAAIEALTATAAVAVTGYVAYEIVDDFDFDRSKLRTHRGEADYRVGGEFGRSGGDPKKPYFSSNEDAAIVAAAVAALSRLVASFSEGETKFEEGVEKALARLSPEERGRVILAYYRATYDGYYRTVPLTNEQKFADVNPLIAEAVAIYDVNKSLYNSDRPWLTEEEIKQQEEKNKGIKAKELLKKAESGELGLGLYIWDGTNWVNN